MCCVLGGQLVELAVLGSGCNTEVWLFCYSFGGGVLNQATRMRNLFNPLPSCAWMDLVWFVECHFVFVVSFAL